MHAAVSRVLFEEQVGRWPPDLAHARGWILHRVCYPLLDCAFTAPGRTTLRLRCNFTDWDELPPSIELLSTDGVALTSLPPNPTGIFNGGPHQSTGRPFICTAGVREFHTHSSHTNEPWEQFRGKPGFDLGDILTKLWNAWRKGSG